MNRPELEDVTFEERVGLGVFLVEPQWPKHTLISKDLIDDSDDAYMTVEGNYLTINVANAHAVYEIHPDEYVDDMMYATLTGTSHVDTSVEVEADD